MNKANLNKVELEKILVELSRSDLDKVWECINELYEVLSTYDQAIAILAIATIGITMQETLSDDE